jgi:hypothetical protein
MSLVYSTTTGVDVPTAVMDCVYCGEYRVHVWRGSAPICGDCSWDMSELSLDALAARHAAAVEAAMDAAGVPEAVR